MVAALVIKARKNPTNSLLSFLCVLNATLDARVGIVAVACGKPLNATLDARVRVYVKKKQC